MKKVVLTLIALVAMAGLVFAAAPEVKPSASLSGSATMTFGFDLDTSAFGISNASSGSIDLTLVPNGSDEKGAEGDVYGWITLKDYELKNSAGSKSLGVEAKLFLGPVYINILGAGNKIDYATKGAGAVPKFNIATSTVDDVNNEITREFNGLVLGLKDTSVLDLSVGVASRYDWTDTDGSKAAAYAIKDPTYSAATGETIVDATDPDYVVVRTDAVANAADINTPAAGSWDFFAKLGLKAVAGLTLDLGVNLSTVTNSSIGFGAKAGYELKFDEAMGLRFFAAFDMKTVASGTMPYQLEVGTRLSFAGSDLADKFKKDVSINPGVGVSFGMDQDSDIDLGVYAYDGALVPVVDIAAFLELGDLNATDLGLGVYVSADAGVVVPYALFKLLDSVTASADSTTLEVGADLKVIANTTFTLKYVSGNLSAATPVKGVITFATKISY